MDERLNRVQLAQLRERLERRLEELTEETRQILLASDEERYIRLAGEVHDLEEQSVADLLVDVQLADIDRHIEEIRDIEAALLRLAAQSYGVCVECGQPIGYARLDAYPTAKRCLVCQRRHEQTHKQPGRSSM